MPTPAPGPAAGGPSTLVRMPDHAAPASAAPTGTGPSPENRPPPTTPLPEQWIAGDFAIQAVSLSKRFGTHLAVNQITLRVPTGTFFGLLGPNGAGKSTTLAMATGLLRPDGGNVMVNGLPVWPDPTEVKATIGVVPENLLLFERLSAREFLTYVGRFRQLDDAEIDDRTDDLLRALDLDTANRKLIADYSQGMRKKISLAAALIHSPPLLILDEPFESVDPVSQRSIRHILDHLISRGRTVVFSSHVMSTVEELCDHVAIMDHGSIIRSGPMGEVTNGHRLDDVFAQAVGTDRVAPPSLDWLQ